MTQRGKLSLSGVERAVVQMLLWLGPLGGCLLPELQLGEASPASSDGGGTRAVRAIGSEKSNANTQVAGDAGGKDAAGASRGGGSASCSVDNGGCDQSPMAVCTQRQGDVVSCDCPGGYSGDGIGEEGCTDIDECATNNGECDTAPRATCTNHLGSAPSCKCPDDSPGDGIGPDGCTMSTMSTTSAGTPAACGRYKCDEQTVYDPETRRTWQRHVPSTYDGCTRQYLSDQGVPYIACTFAEAMAYCMQLSLASGGWRLPARDELFSIVVVGRTPSIDAVAFPNTPPAGFWSATLGGSSPGDTYLVLFSDGQVSSANGTAGYRVRCVR